ncbi:type VI secretion system tube protein Hcp [Dyadobacter sp. CY356]|uniref:type VI secretion system tube protein Hcp n=1 Tax=Dyadobacter sp. CY356 TaxID=2906442 RepID=UPI001F42FD69|nr:type VI secretion system tube protein Hcp [Dyadobacter sp. CY356]MCF0054262.1 type VI secretion system tube protein Hcp [Dyadobacter sp. CY356]
MKTKHFYPILFALLFLSFASQAQSYYLYYPGITVGKGVKGHSDEVYIIALSNGFSKPSPSGPPVFQDYTLSKNNDVTSIDILKYATQGTVTDGVEIRAYATGSTSPVLTIQLKGASITSYAVGGASQDGGCTNCSGLTENITIAYGAIKIGTFVWRLSDNTANF